MSKLVLFFVGSFFLAQTVLAQAPTTDGVSGAINERTTSVVEGIFNPGTDEKSLNVYIGQILSVVLSLLGTVFLYLFIYSGYSYMTAQGDKTKTGKAMSTMLMAIIGMIILVSSYALWLFVFQRLLAPTS